MTGNISSNDLAYYCPPVPLATLDPTRPAVCLPLIEQAVYYIAESISESVRWINIALKHYNREKGPSVFYKGGPHCKPSVCSAEGEPIGPHSHSQV